MKTDTPNVYKCHRCGKVTSGKGQLGTHLKTCGVDWQHWQHAFWDKVNVGAPNGCWEWTASQKEKGYGQFWWHKKLHRAHRLVWKMLMGDPGEKEVAHRCDNRLCVNPDHLFLATHLENMQDCKAKGRQARGEGLKRNKITESQARGILALKPACYPRRTIGLAKKVAAKHNICMGAVHAIWRGDAWRHIQ